MSNVLVSSADITLKDHGGGTWGSAPAPEPSVFPLAIDIDLDTAGRAGFYIDYSELTTNGIHAFYICRTHGTAGAVSVDYETTGDTHTTVSGTINWIDGDASIHKVEVPVTAGNLTTHDSAGLGEHRLVMTLSDPTSGLILHRLTDTVAHGVIDNATMIASDSNAIFVDFDAGTSSPSGSGTLADPYNNWTEARNDFVSHRHIYLKGTTNVGEHTNDNDGEAGIPVFDNKLDGGGTLTGSAVTSPLIVRGWPGETIPIINSNAALTSCGFVCALDYDYLIFKHISFVDLTTANASGTGMCWAIAHRSGGTSNHGNHREHITVDGCFSKATSSTSAFSHEGNHFGANIWRCTIDGVEKSNSTLPNAIEYYDGGNHSIQRCNFITGIIHEKDSPDTGNTSVSVRFCLLNEITRYKVIGTNDASTYTIFSNNLVRNSGLYTGGVDHGIAVYWNTGSGAKGKKAWITNNVIESLGVQGSANSYPFRSDDSIDDHIMFGNVFVDTAGFLRFDDGLAEYIDYNHDDGVTNGDTNVQYQYQDTTYADTAAFNTAFSQFAGNQSSGDSLFTDLANDDITLQAGSPLIASGISDTDKGVYLTGVETIGT
jgi:hypothetical protein